MDGQMWPPTSPALNPEGSRPISQLTAFEGHNGTETEEEDRQITWDN